MMVAVVFCFESFFLLFNAEAKAILCFPSYKVTRAVNCHVKSFRNLQHEIIDLKLLRISYYMYFKQSSKTSKPYFN